LAEKTEHWLIKLARNAEKYFGHIERNRIIVLGGACGSIMVGITKRKKLGGLMLGVIFRGEYGSMENKFT